MFQYAISDGEGTLLDYGTITLRDLLNGALIDAVHHTLIIEACARDCVTGK